MDQIEIDGGRYPDCRNRPLTNDEIKEIITGSDISPWASVIVDVGFPSCIDNDWEWFWDLLSEKVTGSCVGFQDLEYKIVGVENERIMILVSGMFNLEDLGIEQQEV